MVHDWGGAIGLGAAVRRASELRRLVLFNTAAFLAAHPLAHWRVQDLGLGAAIRGLNGFARGATPMAVERPLDPQVRAGYLLPYRGLPRPHRQPALRARHTAAPVAPDLGHGRCDPTRGLRASGNTPTLILWGGRDLVFQRLFPCHWRQRLPDARVVRYDDAGHYVLEDAHAAIVPELARPGLARSQRELGRLPIVYVWFR
ncbi:MAG: hypothetical protein U0Z44_16115 [Kouleothrix sp.]